MRTRSGFDLKIQELQDEMLEMGRLVEEQIIGAVETLKQLDQVAAQRIIKLDDTIDHLRYQIEEHAITLIATQQPMASDLRGLVAVLSIVSELERMGDYAEGTAKLVLLHEDQPLLKPLVDLPRMADLATGMLHRALDAFVSHDVVAARLVIDQDDEIDTLYDQVYRELLTYMMNDPRTIDRATWLLWAAHNQERIADRATNIAERVVFLVTGRME
jgi:phosphate transport system protein